MSEETESGDELDQVKNKGIAAARVREVASGSRPFAVDDRRHAAVGAERDAARQADRDGEVQADGGDRAAPSSWNACYVVQK